MKATNKQKDYILKHWREYALGIDSQNEMLELLNILEYHEKTLDELHDVCLNGYDEFCGIFGTFKNDADVVKALHEYHLFFSSESSFLGYVARLAEESKTQIEDVLQRESYGHTTDGIVMQIFY